MFSLLRTIGAFFLDIMQTVVVALSIFLVMYIFLVQPHQVNGLSMYPNFDNGELLLTDKISYRFGTPERGDVIVLHAPESANCPEIDKKFGSTGCDFIKRLIGLPNEKIEIKNNAVYVNDKKLPEPYLPDDYVTKPGPFTDDGAVFLGPNEYFVVGDNRGHSSDSRAWGTISSGNIVGRAFFRYWPFTKMEVIPKVTYVF